MAAWRLTDTEIDTLSLEVAAFFREESLERLDEAADNHHRHSVLRHR
jgi:hypothetical protein